MAFTRDNMAVALADLGWNGESVTDLPFLRMWHDWSSEQHLDGITLVASFDEHGHLTFWHLYRVSIVGSREASQVTQKLEDQPAPDLWALPTPTEARKLMDRLWESGRGERLLPDPGV